jgi:hypothetical protein
MRVAWMHPFQITFVRKLFNASLYVILACFILVNNSNVASASNDEIDDLDEVDTTIESFYVVKPRTLISTDNEIKLRYSANEEALIFNILILKPETYVFRAQENDNVFENEHVRLYISPKADDRNVYVFGVNHQNAYFDGIYNEQSGLSTDWNRQWHYEVEQHESYWTVEGSIPWKNFSFKDANDTQYIRIGIAKHGNNQQRILSNTPSYIGYTGFVDSLNEIEISIKRQSNFEMFPYYSLNHSLLEDDNIHNVGGELFWQPNQNQSLDLTINPDFGQVESNELVVNFSAVEVFFSEQRPFFTRNQSLFDIAGPENLLLVHTPRIGGSSAYEDIDSRDITAAARYNVSAGAASYSLLIASENKIQSTQGRDFLAARSKYITQSGTWGLSANIVDTPSIERRSTVLGIDYFAAVNDSFEINMGIISSNIRARENSSDLGAWIQSSFEVDDTHLHDFSLFVYGEHLDVNDIGFVQRVDRKQFEYEYSYLIPKPDLGFFEQLEIRSEIELKTNFANERLPSQFGFGAELFTTNGSTIELAIEFLSAGKDDLLTRRFNSTNLDASWIIETVFESPEYDFGQVAVELEYGVENWSGSFIDTSVSLETQLFTAIFAKIELSQYRSDSWLNWEGENNVDEFEFSETGIDIQLNHRFFEVHELRIRLELVAGKAKGKTGNIIDVNGNHNFTEVPDDFAFSEAAFQFRYKYSLSKLSAVFLSYTFGGEFEDDSLYQSKRGLYSKAIADKNTHGIFFKTRLQF